MRKHFVWLVLLVWCGVWWGCQEKTCPVCPAPCVLSDGGAVPPENRPEPPGPEPLAPEPNLPDRSAPLPEEQVITEPTPDTLPSQVSCGPPTGAFYRNVPAIPSGAGVGKVLRCERLGSRTAASLGADTRYAGTGGAANNATGIYRVLYTTQRKPGQLTVASALLMVPQDNKGACLPNAPIAAIAHGTAGMAAQCAPSSSPDFSLHHLTYPLAGRGTIVVAPDYVGLGVAATGGHPYLVPAPTVWAVLDAIKAVDDLSQRGPFTGCVKKRALLLGHSQGGHAALLAAAAFAAGMPGYTHAATVAIAPAFGDQGGRLGPFQANFQTSSLTAYFLPFLLSTSRYTGQPAPNQWLTPKAQQLIPGMLDSFCFSEWTTWLLQHFPTFGDIFSTAFLNASVACQGGKGDCKAFQPWVDAVNNALAQPPVSKAPSLFVQGTKDLVISARSVSCLAERFQAKAAPYALCVQQDADHISVISKSWPAILPWVQAQLTGTSAPTPNCSQASLPACP